jgi:hypothetical protein
MKRLASKAKTFEERRITTGRDRFSAVLSDYKLARILFGGEYGK